MAVTSRLLSAGLSDVGRARRENEDRIHIDADRGIYLVVDGLGGHAAGEKAAEIAVDMITTRLARQTGSLEQRIREAFTVANNEICRAATEHQEWNGMACVATLAVVDEDRVTVGHVGDSRLYVLTPGNIRKVTRDHSPVGELEDSGAISEAVAMSHPRRNEVFRDLGSETHEPDDQEFVEIVNFAFERNMALLVCSDGLSDQVRSTEIRSIVERSAGQPKTAAEELIAAANAAGGKDNVSVVLLEGPNYKAVSAPAPVDSVSRKSVPAYVWLLAGIALAALVFTLWRPYLIETANGYALRNGFVRTPIVWTVGAGHLDTIEAALAQAKAGDTIEVDPGVYRESVKLKSGVALISRQRHGAHLAANGIAVVAENIHNGRFEGFSIDAPATTGIRVVNSSVQLADLEVSGTAETGIEIEESGSTRVQSCRIFDNRGVGLYIHGAAHPVIVGNWISANGRTPGKLRPGVFVAGAANPVFSGNIIRENGVEQMWLSPLFNDPSLLARNVVGDTRDKLRPFKVVTR